MKLSERALKQMILKILKEDNGEADSTNPDAKIKTGVMSTAARLKQSRERIKAAGDELDPTELQIINQIEDKITEIAALPGVDLARHRALLVRILKLLNTTIAQPAIKKTQKGTE